MDDPRLTPAREDLAAKHLEGKILAQRYVAGETFEVADAIAPVREKPSSDATLLTEALKGERVTIYDRISEGWAWGQLARDSYVGWLPDRALAKPAAEPTHRIAALRTFAFPGPSIKLPPAETIVLGARITVVREDQTFAVTREGLFVPKRHVAGVSHLETDFVAVAERFVGTPYLWGGKSSFGVDCSGLVQVSLHAAGHACPRDSDMQQNAVGRLLDPAAWETPRRGDLLFWKGHVAIARDADTIVHANAFHMATVIEDRAEAIARIRDAGSALVAIKRLT
jgi:cell wall-associated NlpC family hydrolase